MEGYVRPEFNNGIKTIEFFHPQGNSLPGKLLEELAQEIHAAGNEEDVKVIILRSSGDKAFCAGASFDELKAIQTAEQGFRFFSGFANLINSIRTCPKFIIGRIHAVCVGGGVGLAAACDYTIAIETSDVKLSELAIGIGPFVVGPAIERKIGIAAFSQLAIDAGLWRNAQWAGRKGLFSEVHPTLVSMDESIHRLAYSLSHSNPEAMSEMKKIFWEGTEHWDQLLTDRARISGRLALSEFTRQAISKFKSK